MSTVVRRVVSALLSCILLMGYTAGCLSCKKNKDDEGKGEDVMLSVVNPKVNHTDTALGIDTVPVFSWTDTAQSGFDNAQKSYRVTVSSSAALSDKGTGDVWDSGVCDTSAMSACYDGDALTSKTRYYWRVYVSDLYGNNADSGTQSFVTGLLDQKEWQGEWISGNYTAKYSLTEASWIWLCPTNNKTTASAGLAEGTEYFRYGFNGDDVTSAVFCFTADDYGTLYVNGQTVLDIKNSTDRWKVGNVADITPALTGGANAVALSVTNSSSGYAGLIGKLILTYSDGKTKTVSTGVSGWRVTDSLQSGWNTAGFDDSGWKSANQYVPYGASPWGTGVALENTGERAALMLRKSINVTKEIESAVAFVTGLGYFYFAVNGKSPDASLLDPCNTQYTESVLYRTFDVTSLMTQGENVLSAEIGHGFFNETTGVWNWQNAEWRDNPLFILNLDIHYTDGTVETVVSDTSWKSATDGPTTFNSIYYGEYYDARLEKDGWRSAGYSDSAWKNAIKAKAPAGALVCQLEDPITVCETFEPEKIKKLSDGSYVIYCPEMVTGWISLDVSKAQSGDSLTVLYGEKVRKNGNVQKLGGSDGEFSGWWPQANTMCDRYICNGKSTVYEPRYSYKGFEYVQIWGFSGELTKDDVKIYRVRSSVKITGKLNTSDALINNLHKIMVTTMLNNLQGKPTDTPVYEKNGWLGDFNVALKCFNYNFDMSNMTPNFVEIMEDCFGKYGFVPVIVPTADWTSFYNTNDHYVWTSVYIYAVAELINTYGMSEYAEEQYKTMAAYAENASSQLMKNGWVCPPGQLADWVSPMGDNEDAPYNESPGEGAGIVGTAMVYGMLSELAEIAERLGETNDAARFRGNMEKIYTAFNERFYNERRGYYETGVWTQYGTRTTYRQTSNVMALAFGLVPENRKEKVVSNLISDIEKKGSHLDTGCVGSRYILPLLSDLGYNELAYTIVTQTTYPSWGFMVENGATSLWEMWETTARSFDHYFLGTYDEWFYSHLAGITDVKNGYESYSVKPFIPDKLDSVSCVLDTERGRLESSWKKENGNIIITLTVPFGACADVTLPFAEDRMITVNGTAKDGTDFTLGSGEYEIIID